MVTHHTTNWPACGLSTAERTGSPVLHTLWSYVFGQNEAKTIKCSQKYVENIIKYPGELTYLARFDTKIGNTARFVTKHIRENVKEDSELLVP